MFVRLGLTFPINYFSNWLSPHIPNIHIYICICIYIHTISFTSIALWNKSVPTSLLCESYWCLVPNRRQSHYLNQWWPIQLTHIYRFQWVKPCMLATMLILHYHEYSLQTAAPNAGLILMMTFSCTPLFKSNRNLFSSVKWWYLFSMYRFGIFHVAWWGLLHWLWKISWVYVIAARLCEHSNLARFEKCVGKTLQHGYIYGDILMLNDVIITYWCAILIAHQIVMAKHGGSCVHFSGISTCGRTSRETVSHPQRQPLPTPYKIFLYPSMLLWQIHGCNL